MKKYSKILKFVKKSQSIITSQNFKENKINYYYINKLIKDDIIKRISTGIYTKTNSFEDEYASIQKRYKKAIFSYNTALFLMGETEVTPDKVDITVPRNYKVLYSKDDVVIHYIKNELLFLGAIKMKSPYGNEIITYNIERTICDIVKNENSLDKEQTNKIIRNCFLNNKLNGTKLIEYSKKLKCEKKIKSIMEVMI